MKRYLDRYRDLADPLRSERRVELLVLVLLLILVVQLAWALLRLLLPNTLTPVLPTADAMRVVSAYSAPAPDPEQRSEIRDRPLFWDTRRPVVAVEEPPPEEAVAEEESEQEQLGKIKNVTLAGVFGSGESAGIIYLAKGKEHRIMVGDEINGWVLESVEPSRAIFSGDGKSAELNLKRGNITVAQPAPSETGGSKTTQPDASTAAESGDSSGGGTLTLGGRGRPDRK